MEDDERQREATRPLSVRRIGERGGALVLVLMVLLVLTAVAMVALRDVTMSVRQAGTFRVRSQAQSFSDGAVHFVSKRVGDKAKQYWAAMKRYQQFAMERQTNLSGRTRETQLGPRFHVTHDPGSADTEQAPFSALLNGSDDETGMFGDSTHRSFEARQPDSKFEVMIRDPVDGIPAPGYSDEFCFKKVTIATRATLGDPKADWSQPRNVGVGRNVIEGLIGPIECGN